MAQTASAAAVSAEGLLVLMHEIPVPGSSGILESAQAVSPALVLALLATLAIALALWWLREARMATQRRMLRSLYRLSERMAAARSPSDCLRMLEAVLPAALRVTGVRLYLHDRTSRTLRRVEIGPATSALPVLTDDPVDFHEKALASCYLNRSLLAIPDTRRSPFYREGATEQPRSAMFVPMFAQSELMGILEVEDAQRVRHFREDEQAVTQHLGNQVAIGMKLLDQQTIREQLFRSEKLAATGQLISGVAEELRLPLEAISRAAERMEALAAAGPAEGALRVISTEARNASEIVTRLLALAGPEREETKAVDLTNLLGQAVERREPVWKERRITFDGSLPPQPVLVEGAPNHLLQVLLSLLVYAERLTAASPARRLLLRVAKLTNRAQVEIVWPSPVPLPDIADPMEEDRAPEAGSLGLRVCRGILRSQGGDLRLLRAEDGDCRFEVELPLVRQHTAAEAPPSEVMGRLTVLLAEPEPADREKLLRLLAEGGHRVVPALSAEEALDFVRRLHFDALFCAVRMPGLSWIELLEKCRADVGAFVLLTDGYDPGLSADLAQEEAQILAKPSAKEDVSRLLQWISARLPAHRG